MTDTIAVIGAGQMGNGIAHVFAQHEFDVTMIDVSADALARGRSTIEKNLDRQVKKGTLDAAGRDATLGRITDATDVAAAAAATLVIEAATENVELKYRIFSDLDRVASPASILATNTSSISITAIAAKTRRPEQVIGMHFMNPVPVMQLVEVNDFPGFVANRVLMPMINEAVFCLMEGVGTAESIDTVMKLGMNHPMGPLALADLIGLDTCLSIMEVLHSGLGDPKYRPCPLLRKYVTAGWLGRKSGRGFHAY